MSMPTLKAGIAQVDVSPPEGVQLQGYPYQTRENTGIHDPLYADCLVLENGETSVALITADLVFFERAYTRELRSAIEKKTGIPAENIMLSGSHTHSGPRMVTKLFESEINQGLKVEWAYLDNLRNRLVDLAVAAQGNLKAARIGFGRGRAGAEQGIGGNRQDPKGLADPAVGVIGIQDSEDRWLAVWVKYSLHPTILQVENKLVSADYPGAIRSYLGKTRPGVPMMFAQGSTGDQSSRYFRKNQSFAEVERFGTAIGREADRVLDTLVLSDRACLAVRSGEFMPEWKEIPPVEELEERVDRYWEELRRLEAENAPYVQRQTCYLDRLGTEYTLAHARLKARGEPFPWSDEVPAKVQALRIGSACLVGLPGEVFVEYTLAIEDGSPFQPTFAVTCANGLLPGYVVSEEAAEKKVFEAGVSMMKPSAGRMLVDTSLELCAMLEKECHE